MVWGFKETVVVGISVVSSALVESPNKDRCCDRVTGAAGQPTDLNREKPSRLPSGDYVHRWRNSDRSSDGADLGRDPGRSLRTPTLMYPTATENSSL